MNVSIPKDNKLLITPETETLLQVTRTLGVGIAIVDPEDWMVLFENANCF